ncbi:MAG: transcriptional regulator [Deltaproteobacteria bacterium]|nr:transcriptional regulator [Deltaproteobacteria bacterium]MBW1916243.1 transcriptional regulator [Deltaproteobacteria bacterium]
METIRQQIIGCLTEEAMSAIDLSQELGVREKEVYEHLPHIARSVANLGKKLVTLPSRCLGCGYTFKDRKRLTRPGRCPKCRSTRLRRPMFEIRLS